MPRPAKGPRLTYRTAKRATKTRPAEPGGWVIRDRGGVYIRTDCRKGEIAEAERELAAYVAEKHEAPRRQRRLHEIPIADVITLYAEDVAPNLATARKALKRLGRLADWWGKMMLDEVTGAACRQFAETRTPGAARRELQDLQAAIGHHHKEGYHRELVRVALPKAGASRERWLTRDEVAKLLWVCWRTREAQDGAPTKRRPLRHLARYILFAVNTGSRPGDVLNASFFASSDRGFVDLESGLYFRRPSGKAETNKRQPTTPLPPGLIAHMRRWRRAGALSVVEHGNSSRSMSVDDDSLIVPALGSIKTAFERAVTLAGLGDDVVPYTLRHTAATWMLQRGAPIWEVAGYLGTSEAMVRKHYGHHCPDHLRQAVEAISGRKGRIAQIRSGIPRTKREA